MQFLELTLNTPAENLALDEALLHTAEDDVGQGEVLRLWESPQPMVVVGRSSKVDVEVHREACLNRNVPILRRVSGGAAIVAGPGCLMYSVVLSYQCRPSVRTIDGAHRFVLDRVSDAVGQLVPGVQFAGTSDLALDGKWKFSGNSLRCRRDHLLYHGTLLYDFPLDLIFECLRMPPRQPEYRMQRAHRKFLTNLPVRVNRLKDALRTAFGVNETIAIWPDGKTDTLAAEKYSLDTWNFSR